MQIVIDIPEKDIPSAQELMTINLHFIAGEVCECSYPYKVLPKGHGRLIDADEVEEYFNDVQLELDGWGETDSAIEIAKARMGLDTVSTIIEAESEVK